MSWPHSRSPFQNFAPMRMSGNGPIFRHWINVAASNNSSSVPSPPGITMKAHEYFTRQTLRVKKYRNPMLSLLEDFYVFGFLVHFAHRHLVRAPGILGAFAVNFL